MAGVTDMRNKLPISLSISLFESIWLNTLEKQIGLEVAEVELIPNRRQI